MDDEALIVAYYACDNSALQTLVERHHWALVAFFGNRALPLDEAETCAQEVWVRVIYTKTPPKGRSPRRFDPGRGTPLGAWMFAIAWNLLRDARQRQTTAPAQMPAGNGGDFKLEIAAPEEPVDADLVAAEVSEAFQAAYQECLEGLATHHRDVLLLELERRELDPVPEQDPWAADHGLTPSQYTSRLHQARKQMRECMQQRLQGDWAL
jgi:DNA-directed RNA polymerase specialized sigma24 family protein